MKGKPLDRAGERDVPVRIPDECKVALERFLNGSVAIQVAAGRDVPRSDHVHAAKLFVL